MNILFIHSVDDIFSPNKPLRSQSQMQFGISYISSLLKKHNHKTELLILSRMMGKKNEDAINIYMKDFFPELVCFTAVSTEYGFIANITKYIKRHYPHIFLLVGGPHVSLNPEETFADDFDALCLGEGEYPTLELVSHLKQGTYPTNIPNLWIKKGATEIEKNVPRPFLQNLDTLSFPDREMWQKWVETDEDSELPVLLGRGCPFLCPYCCNHALKKLATGPYVRFRSTDNIIREIREINIQFPNNNDIYLEVETIGINKKWAIDLCFKLENLNLELKRPLSFRTNLRITSNPDLEALFTAFKKANFKTINIGVESGSEKVRYEILKRNYSNQDIKNIVRLARNYGLNVYFYNLIGIPGETLDDFRETVEINRICQPDRTFNHIFFPYPGTKLYALCKNQGLLPKVINTDLERCRATLNLPGFSKRQIQNGFNWFDYHVYKGCKPLREILAKVLVSILRSNSYLHYFYRKLTFLPAFKKIRNVLSQ